MIPTSKLRSLHTVHVKLTVPEGEDPEGDDEPVTGPIGQKSLLSKIHSCSVSNVPDDSDEIPFVPVGINFSDEQKAIGNAVREGKNVIVDAVAGSGKTTTIIQIAEVNPEKRILALLYNRALAEESRARIGHSNIEIRTIHSAAGNCYRVPCMDDRGIQNILLNKLPFSAGKYDLIIVDEAQDLTVILVRFLRKLISDSSATQLVFMGDYMQCIYRFNEADERFLTMADTFFPGIARTPVTGGQTTSGCEWVRLPLTETYRCTIPVVNFLNNCLLNDQRLVSKKISLTKPDYLVCDAFACGQDINRRINDYIREGNRLEDIAILSFSISGEKTPLAKIANYLTSVGKPIYKPNDDYSSVRDDRLLEGKIVISTFHQFKGRQRKMIIVVGFDEGFYVCNKDAPREFCPNLLYVAATRSLDRLILIHHRTHGALPFLNLTKLFDFANVIGAPRPGTSKPPPVRAKTFAVTDLIKFLPHSFLETIRPLWTVEQVSNGTTGTEIDPVVRFGSISEDVSSIYGSAVPVIKQFQLQGYLGIFASLIKLRGYARDLKLESGVDQAIQLGEMANRGHMLTWEQIAWLINLHNCILDRYVFPIRQINDYSWFASNMNKLNECIGRLDFLTREDSFEEHVTYGTRSGPVSVTVLGSIDCVQKMGKAWEFKLVTELKEEHVLQTIIYSSMLYLQTKRPTDFYLFNSRTGECQKVVISPGNAEIILKRIIEHKLRSGDFPKSLPDLISSIG